MTAQQPLFKELDTVVLVCDLPEAGLKAGDLGAVVQVYSSEAFEVEFVTAAGGTQALLTLGAKVLRAVRDDDLLAVRPVAAAGSGVKLGVASAHGVCLLLR